MSVNVSGRQFKQPDIVEQVEKILRETEVDPSAIKLEITESVTMDNADRTIRVVNGLKQLGLSAQHRRFRDGLFVVELPAAVSHGYAQDRPVVRAESIEQS
jgi:predicted signal transduction protein with EAL and GGDEF domain